MAVTRDDVIQTAIQLLQEVGLDKLTLRRLATELGISAPTLYWHVKDKRELLDLMSEAMVRTAREKMPPFPQGLPWDEKIAEGLRRQYEAIIAYRDGARVVAGNRPTEASLPQIEQFLKMWVEAGFPPNEALAYVLSLGDFVTGCALEYQSEIERQRIQPVDQTREMWTRLEAYPTLRAAVESRGAKKATGAASAPRIPQHSNFERGLRLMMTGLAFAACRADGRKAKGRALDAASPNSTASRAYSAALVVACRQERRQFADVGLRRCAGIGALPGTIESRCGGGAGGRGGDAARRPRQPGREPLRPAGRPRLAAGAAWMTTVSPERLSCGAGCVCCGWPS